MKANISPMRTRGRNKLVLLFLIAVVLPSTILIVLTWHMIGQQEELSEKRLADERRRMARETGHKLLVRLEEIKLHEVSSAAGDARPPETIEYTSDEIILTGLAEGDRLMLPWEMNQTGDKLSPGETSFFDKIRLAEQEEFTRRRFDQADSLYLDSVQEAQKPAEKAYARLLRARVLAKSGRVDESLGEYHKVLAVSSRITDEHGIPFCLYAADRLLERGDSYEEVFQLIKSELNARRWLSPTESYLVRDLINVLVESKAKDDTRTAAAENLRQQILKRISLQEKVQALQRGFPKLAMIAQWNSPNQQEESVWVPYGEELWLVSLAPVLTAGRRLAIVVRGQSILDSVIANTSDPETIHASIRLTTDTYFEGESLGPSFPGLKLVYTTDTGNGFSVVNGGGLQRSFYLIALFLVLCTILFGAYFLWRDLGRELRMAEMRSQFIASVSHELKTPLTSIRIFAETLLMGRAKDPQASQEYLDTIVNESHRLTRLLNNVLDFSKIEKGKRTYHKEPVCLSEIIDMVTQTMQYLLKQEDFNLNVHIEDDLPNVCVDQDAIAQAIINLLSNAMKYSGESDQIDLRVENTGDHVVIEVSDHGIGIAPAQQKCIFEKFYRVQSEQNQRIPGAGLGLALVFHIIDAHDGRIEVQSAPGKGSTFSIHLPLENKQ